MHINTILAFIKSTDHFTHWYQKILWWELMRIPYNLIMFVIGTLCVLIGSISIPFVYLLIGLLYNLLYTGTWIIEILDDPEITSQLGIQQYRKKSFLWTLVISSIPILLLSLYILSKLVF